MIKPVIIHVIDSLKMGGAEVLLKNTIPILPEYDHLVIYLEDDIQQHAVFDLNARLICLKHKGWKNVRKTVISLRKVIKKESPFVVHSHLFFSSLVARLATPRSVPLINTLHSIYSVDAFGKNKKSLWAERMTLKKHHSLIAVSGFVLDDYLAFVPFKGKRYTLYNFLPDIFFEDGHSKTSRKETLKCIAVGNLKEAKNYPYLLAIMEKVRDLPITLDIYGKGQLKKVLQNIIDDRKLRVRLCGSANNIKNILSGYDLFIQASSHEGFGLSVIEAIASRLPVFISDIPVFREVTGNHAHFFSLKNEQEAADALTKLSQNVNLLYNYTDKAYEHAYVNYNAETYRRRVIEIYNNPSLR